MVYTNCFIICVVIVIINKQINKETIHCLLLKSVILKNQNKASINVFDITKKCNKLACMDGLKTWAIVPIQYSIKTWWQVV